MAYLYAKNQSYLFRIDFIRRLLVILVSVLFGISLFPIEGRYNLNGFRTMMFMLFYFLINLEDRSNVPSFSTCMNTTFLS